MNEHLATRPFAELIKQNQKIVFSEKNFITESHFAGKVRYWWCLFAASMLLLFAAAPALPILWIINRRHWLYPICLWGAKKWLVACGAKVKVTGKENLDPKKNYVFISNHRSYLDTATLFAHTGRRIGLVAKKELLKVPVLGQGMGFVNIIAIDRSNPEKAMTSMQKAKKVLERGYSFGIFAEGTRALPSELLPFKKGAFHLAMQTGAPIVPVAIRNTDWMMGKKRGVAYPGELEMILLPPIETKGLSEEDLMDLLKDVRGQIAEQLTMDNGQRTTDN